jgi:hypothetical protein
MLVVVGRAAVLAVLLSAFASPVGAQSPSEVSAARALFREGLEHANAGRWDEARQRFERSYGIAPRLPTLLNLAGAQVQSGRLVAGAESYRRFISEAQRGREARMVGQARDALAAVEPRIAQITVSAPGLGREDAILLDGETLAPAAIGVAVPVDPGAHTLVVRRGETERAREAVELREGERREVTLRVPIDLEVPAEDTPPDEPAAIEEAPASDDTMIWVGVGIGAAVLVVVAVVIGVVFAVEESGAPYTGNLGPGVLQFD